MKKLGEALRLAVRLCEQQLVVVGRAETTRVGERLQKGLDDLSSTLDQTAKDNVEKSRRMKETAEVMIESADGKLMSGISRWFRGL